MLYFNLHLLASIHLSCKKWGVRSRYYVYYNRSLYLRIEFTVQRRNRALATAVKEVRFSIDGVSERRRTRDIRVPSLWTGQIAGVVALFQQHGAHSAIIISPAMTTETILAPILSHLQMCALRLKLDIYDLLFNNKKNVIVKLYKYSALIV